MSLHNQNIDTESARQSSEPDELRTKAEAHERLYRRSLALEEQMSSSSAVSQPVINILVNNNKPTVVRRDEQSKMFQAKSLFNQQYGNQSNIQEAMNQMVAMTIEKNRKIYQGHSKAGSKSSDTQNLTHPTNSGHNSQIIVGHSLTPVLVDPNTKTEKQAIANAGSSSRSSSLAKKSQKDESKDNSNNESEEVTEVVRKKTVINLDNIMNIKESNQDIQGDERSPTSQKSGQVKDQLALDKPPMSQRRQKQLQLTDQQVEIEKKVQLICSSSVMQPIFQAIWKAILTLCFDRNALKAYMRKQNLINVPIRALHYREILCLFRKAHGPILRIRRVQSKDATIKFFNEVSKKASLVTANETVQGFCGFKQFCLDFVRMLGDGVLLLNCDIYSIVAQLVFEACTIQVRSHDGLRDEEEDAIYFRRITDIQSPFYTPMTDHLPIAQVFSMGYLDQIVKLFCMRDGQDDKKRLLQRRFIPQALIAAKGDFRAQKDDQLWDVIEKVMQHSNWKENRSDNAPSSLTQHRGSPDLESVSPREQSTLKKITHTTQIQVTPSPQRIVALPLKGDNSRLGKHHLDSEVYLSENSSEDVETQMNSQPKYNIYGRISDQSKIVKRKKSEPKNAANTDLSISNHGADDGSLPPNVSDKNARFTAKTKKLHRAIDLQELRQFNVHRSLFAKMRKQDADEKALNERQSDSENEQDEQQSEAQNHGVADQQSVIESQSQIDEECGPNDTFHIRQKIHDSGGQLELRQMNSSIPVEVVGTPAYSSMGGQTMAQLLIEENRLMSTAQKSVNRRPLFDFKPLFVTGGILRAQDSFKDPEFDAGLSVDSVENPCNLSFKEEEPNLLGDKKDYMNQSKTFNRQNLQQCRRKNKNSIAANIRQQNQMLESQGYNMSSLRMGGRQTGMDKIHLHQISNKKSFVKNKKSRHAFNGRISSISQNHSQFMPAATERPSPRTSSMIEEVTPRHALALQMQSTFGHQTMSPSVETDSQLPSGRITTTNCSAANSVNENYIMSLQVVTGNSTTSNQKHVSSRGTASWARRASQGNTSSTNSQNARLHSLHTPMQPDSPDSKLSRRVGKLGGRLKQLKNQPANIIQQKQEAVGLNATMMCKTIPLKQEIFQRNHARVLGNKTLDESSATNMHSPGAIPIRLHLAQVKTPDGTLSRDGAMLLRDSSLQPSQEMSNEILKSSVNRDGEDDCTLRADSGIDGRTVNKDALAKALKKANFTSGKTSMNVARNAKIVLIAQKSSEMSKNAESQRIGKIPLQHRISDMNGSNNASDEQDQELSVNSQASDNMSGDVVSSQVSGGIASGHVSGQVSLKAGTVSSVSRARAVNTADNYFRDKKTLEQDQQQDQQYKSDVIGDNIDVSQDNSITQDRSIPVEDRGKIEKRRINLGEISRWQASLEEDHISENEKQNSDKPVQAVVNTSEAISSNQSYQRQPPRDTTSIDRVSHNHPPRLIDSNILDLSKRSSGLQVRAHEFVAPRRAMSRKQRVKVKTPINLLALHDVKGVKNVNLTICNQDLIQSRFETETMNLSQSFRAPNSIHQMQQNLPSRHVSVGPNQQQMVRNQQRKQMQVSQLMPIREPTPLRIVDLSTGPEPTRSKENTLSIKEDYRQHFPLLRDRQKPLKQDILRKLASGRASPLSTIATSGRRSPMTQTINGNKTQGVDLRSMVGYMVKSPAIMSPTTMADTPTIKTLTNRQALFWSQRNKNQ